MNKEYFSGILCYLNTHRPFYPPKECILKALSYFEPSETKVIILGQDPYHGENQAMGLAFSVNEGIPTPPSLRNIYKEIGSCIDAADGGHNRCRETSCDKETPGCGMKGRTGSLIGWAEQGVLLLNTTLTVRPASPGSHSAIGWQRFTDAIIRKISSDTEGCVFLLWGNDARKKTAMIDEKRHLVLCSAHPSPLSASRGFFGCGHFRKANAYLAAHGRRQVQW